MVRQTARANEDEDEILTGVQVLAEERAQRLSRPLTSEDVEYFLSMFCWNPLKPDPPEHVQTDLQFIRQRAFRRPLTDESREEWLLSFVRDEAFTWTNSELYEAQQDGVERFLRFETQPAAQASDLATGQLTQRLVGATVSGRDEINGYWFWGLVALFIGIPELLAAFSKTLKADIPWPTISNLVGKDLERHHHWIALLVVGLIVIVTVHTLTYPTGKKKAGRALRKPSEEAIHLPWGGRYIVVVAVAGAAAGMIASAAGANKNELGYAIYITLSVFGILVPSALAYLWNRVLAIPTLFATVAFLRARRAWVALLVVALLVVLMFHLALYPWPNYHFGSP